MKNFTIKLLTAISLIGLLASCHVAGYHKDCDGKCNSQKNETKVEEPKTNVQPQEKKVKKVKKVKKTAATPVQTKSENNSKIVKETKTN